MADLPLSIAQSLAGSLITVGHPYHQAAINGTAMDLVTWCKGAVVDGCFWTPEQQAAYLVNEVRTVWGEWPDKGGTRRLLELYRERFERPDPPRVLSYEETLARGLIRPPCARCDDSGYVGTRPDIAFCACRHGRYQKDWEGERGLQRINSTEPTKRGPAREQTLRPFTPITEADMQKALEDERRRKAEQLRKLGLD